MYVRVCEVGGLRAYAVQMREGGMWMDGRMGKEKRGESGRDGGN